MILHCFIQHQTYYCRDLRAFERLSYSFFNKSHPAFWQLSTKVSLLLKGFIKTTVCVKYPWRPQISCFHSIVKSHNFVAKICKYCFDKCSEGFCCGCRKPANPCHPAPVCIKFFFKAPPWEDTKLHWLNLFRLSPLCEFSNVASNCISERMHSHTGCICLVFLHCVFSNVSSNQQRE